MTARPFTLLIAALGGEGGGVLADWLVDSAMRAGLPVQATSVPGVAQRTGATSYYFECLRDPVPDGQRPVFALMPVPGLVDVVLASELLEAGRMIERGFVSPRRTLLVTADHRVLTTAEKMQMADGRYDDERLHAAGRALASRYLALDLRGIAERNRTVISAVMFGALAGSGVLPWSRECCEDAIRAGGIGVDASLAGFAEAFRAASADPVAPAEQAATGVQPAATATESLATVVALGEGRARDYQGDAYAARYRSRVDALSGAAGTASPARQAVVEAARQLALWMTYEDVIRVADLKVRPERQARVRAEAAVGEHDVVEIREHFSPKLAELAAIAPLRIGRMLRARAREGHPVGARGQGRTLASNSVVGFALLKLLAAARRWRPLSLRFHEEQAAIDDWLGALQRVLPLHPGYALALAALPRLRKGYSDTWARGVENYERIFATLVSPVAGREQAPGDEEAAALRAAIDAALADPARQALGATLAAHEARRPLPTSGARDEQPIHFRPLVRQRDGASADAGRRRAHQALRPSVLVVLPEGAHGALRERDAVRVLRARGRGRDGRPRPAVADETDAGARRSRAHRVRVDDDHRIPLRVPSESDPVDPRGSRPGHRGPDDGSLLRQLRHDADAEDRLRPPASRLGPRSPWGRRCACDAGHGVRMARRATRRP
jgi:indolepyruvate ferredoxin oxidoreductase beta subunit